MGAVTARGAVGCQRWSVCSPPPIDDGHRWPRAGWPAWPGVYRMGGAQAIAALAYGTDVGRARRRDRRPGATCTCRKPSSRSVAAEVGIDGFAGPSDLVVLLGRRLGVDRRSRWRSTCWRRRSTAPGTLVVAVSRVRRAAGRTSTRFLWTRLRRPVRLGGDGGGARMLGEGLALAQSVRPRASGADRSRRRVARDASHPGRVRVRRRGVGDRVRRLHRGLKPHPPDQRGGALCLRAVACPLSAALH